MGKKTSIIEVQGTAITVATLPEGDYISLTDMLKAKDGEFFISDREFIAKIGTVAEEADESAFWMELIMEGGLLNQKMVLPLHTEAEELTAIFTASGRTAKLNNQKSAIPNPNSTMCSNPQSAVKNRKC